MLQTTKQNMKGLNVGACCANCANAIAKARVSRQVLRDGHQETTFGSVQLQAWTSLKDLSSIKVWAKAIVGGAGRYSFSHILRVGGWRQFKCSFGSFHGYSEC